MKKRPLFVDAVLGLFLTAGVLASHFFQLSLLERIELKAYDQRSLWRQSVDAGSDIAIIAIDDASIARLGSWPWSRARIAEMIDLLAQAKPKVIGLGIPYGEPEANQGLIELRGMQERYGDLVKSRKLAERGASLTPEFASAAVRLDTDARLAQSLAAAKNVVLPMVFAAGATGGAKPGPLPSAVSSGAFVAASIFGVEPGGPAEWTTAAAPLAALAEKALGTGHVNVSGDIDGVVRREAPVMAYAGEHFPSFALQVALASLGLKPSDAKVVLGDHIEAGQLRIPLDPAGTMLVSYSGPFQSFRYFPFHEVLGGKVALDLFKDKIVLIGLSAPGLSRFYATPVGAGLPPVELAANAIDTILRQNFLERPEWAWKAEAALILAAGLFLILGLPRLGAAGGAAATLVLLSGVLAAGTALFIRGEWLKVVYPAVLLAAGYIVLMMKRLLFAERGADPAAMPAVAASAPIAKAETAATAVQDKAELPSRPAPAAAPTEDSPAAAEAKGGLRKLGRYEIEAELGRGAMGVVYLGRDPKINRKVAIKTLVIEDGGEGASLKEVKERFFREAESAGTLNHPNIVRIFDAGEESDISYIAMELLEGHDLVRFTNKAAMLPVETAMRYAAVVADALDYAHAQGIVHRDIKPANIMLLKDGTIRVADFGIARITASSKTVAGTVMGTPSYMSPEQVAGKPVDGRSDLFSLGVALFELLTGEKPFKGGDGIGAMLFQIANDPEPEPLEVNPALPPCVSGILHKALKKNPAERYQRAREFAADIRSCAAAAQAGVVAASASGALTAPIPVVAQRAPEQVNLAPAAGTTGDATVRLPAVGRAPEPAPPQSLEPTGSFVELTPATPPIVLVRLEPRPGPEKAAGAPDAAPREPAVPRIEPPAEGA